MVLAARLGSAVVSVVIGHAVAVMSETKYGTFSFGSSCGSG